MSVKTHKGATLVATLVIYGLVAGAALQTGVALTSRTLPRVEVIEIRAVNEPKAAEMATTLPRPPLPGRYQY